MLPRLFSIEWGNLVFHLNGYGFSILCGALAALLMVLRRAKEASLPIGPLLWVCGFAILGGFAGARIAYGLQYGRLGGAVLYGGLLGGLATGLAVSRRFGLAPLAVADLAAPCALLAAAFGRLGCFFAGCCYGTVWDGGVAYPAASHAWRAHRAAGLIDPESLCSLPTVPAPLLEFAALFAIFVAASPGSRRKQAPGRALATCGLLYSVWRFAAEFWRGDHSAYWGSTLTFSQGISLVVFAAALRLWFVKSRPAAPHPAGKTDGIVWAQLAAMLLLVAVVSGGVGCSAKDRYDAADDCMSDCMSSCTDSCIESCNEDCERKANEGPRTAADPEGNAPVLRFPPIEPARPYAGKLALQGTLNTTELALRIAGTFSVSTKDAAGNRLVSLQISELELQLGNLSLSSAGGDAEIHLDAKGRATLRNATLPADVISVLKAFEPLSRGFLQVESEAAPDKPWSERLLHQVNLPNARAECRGEFTLNGERHPLEATALITRTADKELRVQWLPRR